ncbi:MAG TPA: O-methyltransferase, partial [bacterium]|nr:O-methyltransferase [bacterium]
MELVDEAFTSYLEGLIPARPPVLQEMEAYARKARFPIVGPVVGHLFYLLTRLGGARRVFELGSGYGYSTAWFAMGVRDNGGGEVFHVVWDE